MLRITIRKIFSVLFLITIVSVNLHAQISSEHFALNNIHKQKWERAFYQLKKAIRKDSVNALARYVLALYFADQPNPKYQLDSAYKYSYQSLENFASASLKQRDKMRRFPLDSTILFQLRAYIDSAAFEQAKHENTEKAYLNFLFGYPEAIQKEQAIELRDEVAYLDALKINTYQSFQTFLAKYPQANQVDEAKKRYDKLLFEDKTRDKRLLSYETFLKDFPGTPYRKEVEKNIFEISTASGAEQSFLNFIEKYPKSYFTGQASNIVFHLLLEKDVRTLPHLIENDSLIQVLSLNRTYLIPFLKEGKFGFMDSKGNEIISPQADDIDRDYLCGNIIEDVIVLQDRVLSNSGIMIFKDHVDELSDLGFGFLMIKSNAHYFIVHKSGQVISEIPSADVKLLGGKFLAFKKDNKWSILTLTGKVLSESEWDEVDNIQDVLILKKGGKFRLATTDQLGLLADKQKLKSNDAFDEIKVWHSTKIWVRSGAYEGILDQTLKIEVPFEKASLSEVYFGGISSSTSGKKIFLNGEVDSGLFKQIKISKPWVAVKQAKQWRLFDPKIKKIVSSSFDSISFIGPYAVGHDIDTLTVYFQPNKSVEFMKSKLEFIPVKDSVSFLLIDDGEKKSIYNSSGLKLFTAVYDKIQFAGEGVFIVTKKEKKGLVSMDGKPLLPIEFDAIGSAKDNMISLLKSMKFGLYQINQNRQIKPQYEKNIMPYTEDILVAFKDGLYGFIGWESKKKEVDKFEFEEIRFWSDSIAWVKKNFQWMLYRISDSKILLDNIKDYKLVTDRHTEKSAIFHQANKYGVIDSKLGLIIPATFNDIKNIGSSDDPLFFSEKNVEEASLFIVIYYSKLGELVKRNVYEEEEYDRLFCPD